MRRTTLVAALVAALALTGAGGLAVADDGAAQEDMVTIELDVATADGVSVGNADVTIEWDGGSTEASTRSNGRVLVDVPEGADLEIEVNHSDYVRNVPHEVTDVQAEQVVDVTMWDRATAEIEVLDGDGAPVEGARVQISRHGQSGWADDGETDADGIWTSGDVEAGTYTVRVTEPGYYHESQTVDLEGATEQTIEIEEGDVTVDLFVQDPTPEGPGPLSADVEITLDDERVVGVTTNDAGRRSVSLAVNTRYEAEVTRDGYQRTVTVLRTGEEREEFSVNVTREESISLTADNDQVVVGENLRVTVTDEYDRPVEGATVTVGGEEAGETDADGVARVEIPEEGDVEVAATYDDLETDSVTVTGVTAGQADGDTDETDDTDDSDEGDEDDGEDESDGSPGFGVVPALVAALLATAAAARRR